MYYLSLQRYKKAIDYTIRLQLVIFIQVQYQVIMPVQGNNNIPLIDAHTFAHCHPSKNLEPRYIPQRHNRSSNCLCKDKQERAESIPKLLGMNIRKNCVSLPCGTNGSFHHFSHIASIRLAMLVCLAYHALLMRYSYATHAQVAHRFKNGMPPACTLQLCTHLVRKREDGHSCTYLEYINDSTDKGDIGYQFLLKSDIPYCRKTV